MCFGRLCRLRSSTRALGRGRGSNCWWRERRQICEEGRSELGHASSLEVSCSCIWHHLRHHLLVRGVGRTQESCPEVDHGQTSIVWMAAISMVDTPQIIFFSFGLSTSQGLTLTQMPRAVIAYRTPSMYIYTVCILYMYILYIYIYLNTVVYCVYKCETERDFWIFLRQHFVKHLQVPPIPWDNCRSNQSKHHHRSILVSTHAQDIVQHVLKRE